MYFFIALSSQSKESFYITLSSELVKTSLLESIYIWVTHSSGKYQTEFMPYIPRCLKCVIMGYYDSSSTSKQSLCDSLAGASPNTQNNRVRQNSNIIVKSMTMEVQNNLLDDVMN